MPDWPSSYPLPVGQLITTLDYGRYMTAPASAVVAQNRAVYIPIRVVAPFYARKIFVVNGATVSGNIDLGIYTQGGNRIASMGSTAQGGTGTIQEFDMTDMLLAPEIYYLAVALDNATGRLLQTTPGNVWGAAQGVAQQANAFPLPAAATFATQSAGAKIPVIGLAERTLL